MHTIATAAAAVGRNKTAILRAIEAGKITVAKDENGEWQIDPACPSEVCTSARVAHSGPFIMLRASRAYSSEGNRSWAMANRNRSSDQPASSRQPRNMSPEMPEGVSRYAIIGISETLERTPRTVPDMGNANDGFMLRNPKEDDIRRDWQRIDHPLKALPGSPDFLASGEMSQHIN